MPPFELGFVVLGCVGGLIPDILRIIKNRYRKDLLVCLGRLNFWLGVVLLIGLGGLAAWVLEAQEARDALIYGYAAPQLFSELAGGVLAANGAVDRGLEDRKALGLLNWWAS